ncbi:MAG: nucleoside triphosphate pyrophosphohydrolase ham1, partial [Paramarteilia canceri]
VCLYKCNQIAQKYTDLLTNNYIICNDNSLTTEVFNGLPGPFYKYFDEILGDKMYEIAVNCGKLKASSIYAFAVIGCELKKPEIFVGQSDGELIKPQHCPDKFGFEPIFEPYNRNEQLHKEAFDKLFDFINQNY